jgi:segregation and condensation protein B
MNLEQKIEALLFWKAEPLSIKKIASLLKENEESVKTSIHKLQEDLKNRGICLMEKGEEFVLATNPELSNFFSDLSKDELNRDIGKAGMETLSIVLYQSPVSRKEIDYIRGVNSGFILRNLMIRGLVEKIEDPKDHRSFLYKPTFELLSFMGISNIESLPDYDLVRKDIETFKGATKNEDEKTTNLEETVKEDDNG